ncbi:hypothetical protein [Sunxiuqinia sp. sy24]|uniref:hypothetical protein n=1 Tax=Sunxiuqinia sp. sy24 TaxID=3461495 RepID=UPI00404671D9
MKSTLIVLFFALLVSCVVKEEPEQNPKNNLVFNDLAATWDEAMPFGNAMVGALVWQKEGKLRFSLDRADLWDLRPMGNIDFDKWKFQNVYEHRKEQKLASAQWGALYVSALAYF